MTKRDVIRTVFSGGVPPYVPWWFWLTHEAAEKLRKHYGGRNLDEVTDNHVACFGQFDDFYTDLPDKRVRDHFGVVWDRSIDEDIGVVENSLLPEPTLRDYRFPDPLPASSFATLGQRVDASGDQFRVFMISFSLYERAWTLRGMENLMMDFVENPQFVHDLLDAITDYQLAQVREAVKHDMDAVYFGDDWGQQCGLQIGYPMWREFIRPRVGRLYAEVRKAGKFVMQHSCGDVDELFDDLVDLGLNCFNPFQPEVMDVFALLPKYRGKMCFHGGLSTQRTLPYGTPDEVRTECRRLLDLGRQGGYIFNAAHAVDGDVPVENIVVMVEEALEHRRRCLAI